MTSNEQYGVASLVSVVLFIASIVWSSIPLAILAGSIWMTVVIGWAVERLK